LSCPCAHGSVNIHWGQRQPQGRGSPSPSSLQLPVVPPVGVGSLGPFCCSCQYVLSELSPCVLAHHMEGHRLILTPMSHRIGIFKIFYKGQEHSDALGFVFNRIVSLQKRQLTSYHISSLVSRVGDSSHLSQRNIKSHQTLSFQYTFAKFIHFPRLNFSRC